jgi:cobalt-zinc-cadmium efflux system membrane fusion protein
MSDKPSRLGKRLAIVVILLLLAGGGLAAYLSGVPIPGLRQTKASPAEPPKPPRLKVELVAKNTIRVPEEVRKSLGMRKGNTDIVDVAVKPTLKRPLVLSGSTMLDFNNIIRVKARFAPAEIVKIEPYTYITNEGTQQRMLQIGDYVTKGTPLAVFYSIDVGSKKNDLIDALVSYKFDNDLYDRAKQSASLPPVIVEGYRKNVQTDENAIKRALKYLKMWEIPKEDVDTVYKEAEEIVKNDGKRKPEPEKTNENEIDPWGKVVLKAPASGFIVEQNVAEKELVVDPTICLYQIANTDKLLVTANCPEEDVKELYELKEYLKERSLKEKNLPGLQWTLRPLGESESDGTLSSIDEIGQLVDPNMHTVPLRGRIPNKNRILRAGQYVTATIELPAPKNVAEIPAAAVADDGKQAIVFVQIDPKKDEYTMRRVVITHRFEDRVFVRSELSKKEEKLSSEDREQGLMPKGTLQIGDRVITSGLLELKKELEDLEIEKGE